MNFLPNRAIFHHLYFTLALLRFEIYLSGFSCALDACMKWVRRELRFFVRIIESLRHHRREERRWNVETERGINTHGAHERNEEDYEYMWRVARRSLPNDNFFLYFFTAHKTHIFLWLCNETREKSPKIYGDAYTGSLDRLGQSN